jgi:hypothetical protein
MKHDEKARNLRQRFPQIIEESNTEYENSDTHSPTQRIVEIEPEAEPIKPISTPTPIPTADRKVMLDTGKFRSDLRIALINGAKVWLQYNNSNEVISVVEV